MYSQWESQAFTFLFLCLFGIFRQWVMSVSHLSLFKAYIKQTSLKQITQVYKLSSVREVSQRYFNDWRKHCSWYCLVFYYSARIVMFTPMFEWYIRRNSYIYGQGLDISRRYLLLCNHNVLVFYNIIKFLYFGKDIISSLKTFNF